jgi:hypothetical protein
MSGLNDDQHGVQYEPNAGQKAPSSNDRQGVKIQMDGLAHILTPSIDRKEEIP